jgi:hypothetical protein
LYGRRVYVRMDRQQIMALLLALLMVGSSVAYVISAL